MDIRQDAGDGLDCLIVKLIVFETQLSIFWIVIIVELIERNDWRLVFLAIVLEDVLIILLGPPPTNLLRLYPRLAVEDMRQLRILKKLIRILTLPVSIGEVPHGFEFKA